MEIMEKNMEKNMEKCDQTSRILQASKPVVLKPVEFFIRKPS
jgi:hypothetical protein